MDLYIGSRVVFAQQWLRKIKKNKTPINQTKAGEFQLYRLVLFDFFLTSSTSTAIKLPR